MEADIMVLHVYGPSLLVNWWETINESIIIIIS